MGHHGMDDELGRIRAKKLAELERLAKGLGPGTGGDGTTPDMPVEVTSASFKDFISRHQVAVVDCWAAWCGPCKMMDPVIERLAKELAGKVAFGKLNVDAHPDVAGGFQVSSIPTLLVFRNGRLVDRMVGAQGAAAIRGRLGV